MAIYQRLINKVIAELGLRSVKGAELADEPVPILQALSPIVTVSRDPGSGGRPIAKKVAEELGFTYYDEELVDEIAKSAKLRKGILTMVDEKGRSLITDFVHSILNPEYVSDVEYMRHLCKVVLGIATRGKAVILGRGANFIVPSASSFRVHISAPYRVRLRRAMRYEGYTSEEARKILKETQDDRSAFVKQYFGTSVDNPDHYDVMLNTAFYNLEQSAKVVVTAFRQKFMRGTM